MDGHARRTQKPVVARRYVVDSTNGLWGNNIKEISHITPECNAAAAEEEGMKKGKTGIGNTIQCRSITQMD